MARFIDLTAPAVRYFLLEPVAYALDEPLGGDDLLIVRMAASDGIREWWAQAVAFELWELHRRWPTMTACSFGSASSREYTQ